MDRRYFLKAASFISSLGLLKPTLSIAANENAATKDGLRSSDLVYLTPIKSNGKESRCQAEIWFVYDGAGIYVCTDTKSWRANAPRQGLTDTKIWVGDLGRWQKTKGQYKKLPTLMADASIEADPQEQKRILELFGDKYSLSWLVWGPRFRKGIADGSRTMIKYQPV